MYIYIYMAGSSHSTPCRSGGGARFEEAGYAVSALQAPDIGFGGLSEYRFTPKIRYMIYMDLEWSRYMDLDPNMYGYMGLDIDHRPHN